MNPDFTITGLLDIQGTLDGAATRALTLEMTAFPLVLEDFQRMSAERFGAEGPGWAPLSPTTVAIKTREGYSQPDTTMVASGDLLFSLAGITEHTVHEIGPESILMGTSLPYARFHQDGPRLIQVFGRGSAILPERKVIDVSEADAARWALIVSRAMSAAGSVAAMA